MSEDQETSKAGGNKTGRRAAMALAAFVVIAGLVFWRQGDDLDLWIKALHVIAVMSWMAGLLYLPRLFVYHSATGLNSDSSELFKVMETRLYRFIMNPAMMIAWILGLYLAWSVYGFHGGWLHAKLLLVVLLSAAHVYLGRSVRSFSADQRPLTGKAWRMINEIPTILMILIVILVIVKPF